MRGGRREGTEGGTKPLGRVGAALEQVKNALRLIRMAERKLGRHWS